MQRQRAAHALRSDQNKVTKVHKFYSSMFFKLGPNKVDYRKSSSQVDWRYIHLHIFCMCKETKRTFLTPLKRVSYSYNLKCLSLLYDHTLKVSISQIFQKGHFYSVSWKYPPRKLREHSWLLISQALLHILLLRRKGRTRKINNWRKLWKITYLL